MIRWVLVIVCLSVASVRGQSVGGEAALDAIEKLVVGNLDPAIEESSGFVASRTNPGVFWTHGDSGNKPELFAVDGKGKLLATYPIAAKNVDWEDIATDDAGNLYIGDFGNNAHRANRGPVVYRVIEPKVLLGQQAIVGDKPLRVDFAYQLSYAGKPFDCEALFTWKQYGYVISKSIKGGRAELFRFSLTRPLRTPQALEKVCDLPIRAPVTAADMLGDGKEMLVLTVFGPSRFIVDGKPEAVATATARSVTFLQPDMEAAALVPEGVLATTEGGHMLLFTNDMFDGKGQLSPDEPVRMTIPQNEKPIAVDGDVSEWDDRTKQPLRSIPADARDSATLWTTWTADGLYLAARVPTTDPKPLVDQWFNGDVIEIFLGRQSVDRLADYAAGDDRCYIGFAKQADGSRGEIVLRWPRQEAAPAGGKVAGKLDETGYVVEAFIPASAFGKGQPLQADDEVRLNVSILARDPRRNWYLSTSNTDGTWLSPLKWGIATFKEGE